MIPFYRGTIKVQGINFDTPGEDVLSVIPKFFDEFVDDPDLQIIYSGPYMQIFPSLSGPKTEAIRTMITRHLTPTSRICFDDMHEGNVTTSIIKIHEIIKDIVPASQVYYFTAALNAQDIYNTIAIKLGITDKIHIYVCNAWEYHLINTSTLHGAEYTVKLKDKMFLCFNRVARIHRLGLLGLVADANLLDNCYYSYMNASYGAPPVHIDHEYVSGTIENIQSLIKIKNGLKKVKLPLKLNIDAEHNINFVRSDDLTYFENSYLSVVTETFFYPYEVIHNHTMFYEQESIFFSEKIYKPILMKHPFIIVSVPGSLAMLKHLGYRTFEGFIDETYDTIKNNTSRLRAIVNEMKRLSNQTPDQWIEWQLGVKAIVEHNYSVIINRPMNKYAIGRN